MPDDTLSIKAIQRDRLIAAAKRYAMADRSDPFAFARCMTHINNGIAAPDQKDGLPMYDATAATETRTLEAPATFSDGGTEYPVTVYRSIRRP